MSSGFTPGGPAGPNIRTIAFMAGGMAAAYALGMPAPEALVHFHSGFLDLLADYPDMSAKLLSIDYTGGVASYLAAAGSNIGDHLHACGETIGAPLLQMVDEMKRFVGNDSHALWDLFASIHNQAGAIGSWVARSARSVADSPWEAVKEGLNTLALLSGAWAGVELLRKGYSRAFKWASGKLGRTRPQADAAKISNEEVALSLAGDRMSEKSKEIVRELIENAVRTALGEKSILDSPTPDKITPASPIIVPDEKESASERVLRSLKSSVGADVSDRIVWKSARLNSILKSSVSMAAPEIPSDVLDMAFVRMDRVEGGIIYAASPKILEGEDPGGGTGRMRNDDETNDISMLM